MLLFQQLLEFSPFPRRCRPGSYASYWNLFDDTGIAGSVEVPRTVNTTGNIKIGGSASRATTVGSNALHIFDGTAPAGTLANGGSIYSAAGELFTMDAAGNATLQTPHDDKGEWVFYSKNTVTGRTLKIDMERMMRKLNDMFGGDFIHEFTEEVTP